jgi:hypothetical protein
MAEIMRSKLPIWSLVTLACSGFLYQTATAEEPGASQLWEASKDHLKNPLKWPSVWRLTPQAGDPGDMRGWQDAQVEKAKANDLALENSTAATTRPPVDWKNSEERRTRNYLAKVGPLQSSGYLPMPPENAGSGTESAVQSGPVKHYLSKAVVLTTPFLGETGEGGGYFPRECTLRYSSSNESEILQMFDEVVINSGLNHAVKTGDLYRTYSVGSPYRSYVSGVTLGRIIETNGIIEIIRVGAKSSVGRLVKCFGTISKNTRACPLVGAPEVATTGYSPVTESKLTAQVIWVTTEQQIPQPFSYAIVDRGAAKGYKIGDMVLFFNRNGGKMTDKILGNGIVINIQEKSATILIKDLYPGIINRGDYSLIVQTAMM